VGGGIVGARARGLGEGDGRASTCGLLRARTAGLPRCAAAPTPPAGPRAPARAPAPCSSSANSAVKKGVPEPTAWLKLTAMKRSDMLPSTMVTQKIEASRQTFHSCRRERSGLIGNDPTTDST
jgi:hypothetical protein